MNKKHKRVVTKKTREKISKALKGRTSWNEGLTKETDIRLKRIGEKISKSCKGRKAWITGLTKETDIRVNKMSKKLSGRKITKKHSDNISIALKGKFTGKESPRWNSVQTICPICEKKRFVMKSKIKRNNYCSVECLNIDMSRILKEVYKKHPEIRKKISKASRGRKLSLESRKKISKSVSGKKHPNWQGGISFMSYPTIWTESLREKVRERDMRMCQLCGITEKRHKEIDCRSRRLSVHHIDYNKENCKMINLISLCAKCSNLVHYKRNFWLKYFQTKSGKKKRE